jgi:hypothetical protein
VTEGVVDLLKVVDVKEKDRKRVTRMIREPQVVAG